ncbi:MAG: DNA mismatch repair protein MutS [Holophagae bacterium]|nr:MAG: DNA mismatch repair protein MutS [Holophagae bacterium]
MPAPRSARVGAELAGTRDDASAEPAELVELPIEDFIDLHPFPPRDIPSVVDDYLRAAHARGFREVRLIHGRGIGVQRERVRSVLSTHPVVTEYHDAPPERGGWGATVVVLKNAS